MGSHRMKLCYPALCAHRDDAVFILRLHILLFRSLPQLFSASESLNEHVINLCMTWAMGLKQMPIDPNLSDLRLGKSFTCPGQQCPRVLCEVCAFHH
jgi:hypothetical protein